VSDALHYRFPPAGAYRLNRCLHAIKSDPAFRARYRADPEAAMTALGLDEAERAALTRGDRDGLLALGAHAYLVFMADLRLRMEDGKAAFEYF
jgi:aromatic-ring opening dioxygenase LigAB LigA subunit